MSNQEAEVGTTVSETESFSRLAAAVEAAVDEVEELRTRLKIAQARGREMEEQLRRFTGGEEDPAQVLGRLKTLETQNRDLLDRLQKGREGVERLLARIRFLEEQG